MNDRFHRFIAERYPIVKSTFPGEGRRKWRLRVIEELWLAPESQVEIASAALNSQDAPEDAAYENDDDPLDEVTECDEVGLLVRTDFSNDVAWGSLVQKLQTAERDFLITMTQPSAGKGNPQVDDDAEMNEGGESDSESEAAPKHIIKIVASSDDQLFHGISNLSALRLLNDVAIRKAPSPPTGAKRLSPGNRLIDRNGLQEIYTGKTVWIYDAQSNVDGSVRLVSQQGSEYGTATGDSWRARAPHVVELQFNISFYNMKINFGGLDRWDHSERVRNLHEAESHR